MKLCRKCHDKYGDRWQYKELLQATHEGVIQGWGIPAN